MCKKLFSHVSHPLAATVARVRTGAPSVLLLAQADEPPLVAGELRLVLALAGDFALGRIVLDEEDDEGGEDEGKDARTEEGDEVPQGRGEGWRQGEVRLDHRGRE